MIDSVTTSFPGSKTFGAGELSALEKLAAEPPERARITPLKVAGAFHTRFMAPAEEALRGWIDWSGLPGRADELASMLRKCDSHGERLGALFDHGGERTLPSDRPVFVTD